MCFVAAKWQVVTREARKARTVMPPTTKWSRTRTRTRTRRRSRLYFRMEYHGDDLTSGLDSGRHSVPEVLKYPSTPVPRAGLEAQDSSLKRLGKEFVCQPRVALPHCRKEQLPGSFWRKAHGCHPLLPLWLQQLNYLSTEYSRIAFWF